MPPSPTSQLLEQWQHGDAGALARLLERHQDWLVQKIHQQMTPLLRSRNETLDLVQDCLLEFLVDAPRFHIENAPLFRGLLLMIAKRTVLQEYRWWAAKRRELARECPLPEDTLLELEDSGEDPCLLAGRNEELSWVRLGLEFLTPEQQMLIVLRDFDKLDWASIGEKAGGIAADAARMRYARAYTALSAAVAQLRAGRLRELLGTTGDEA